VAYLVDIAAATVSDWKLGHCTTNPFLTREACCSSPLSSDGEPQTSCAEFIPWRQGYTAEFGVYVAFALVFGIVSAGVTMLTKTALPSAGSNPDSEDEKQEVGKTMYMAAGSGIPEIKTILGGFVIPDFLSVKVLVVKAVGAVFAVSTGELSGSTTFRTFC
jgi:chloride channel 3/4/5